MKADLDSYDALICLSVETTECDPLISGNRPLYMEKPSEIPSCSEKGDSFPYIIRFDWCAYDLKSRVVSDENNLFVKPPNLSLITEAVVARTGITTKTLEEAKPLSEVLQSLNQFIFNSFILKNQSFTFVTFGDWVLGHQLPIECYYQNIKLPAYFTWLNVHRCFVERYPEYSYAKTLSSMMEVLQLQEKKQSLQCLTEYMNLVRIINKLVKEGYKFCAIQKDSPPTMKPDTKPLQEEEKRDRSRSRDKSAELSLRKTEDCFGDIAEFMAGIILASPDIEMCYNTDGQFIKESVVRLPGLGDLPLALSYSNRIMKKQLIEITEATEKDFEDAKASGRASKANENSGELGSLRMRGLPFDVTDKEIAQFFAAYQLKEGCIKLGVNASGQRTGEAVVQFKNAEEAKKAYLEKQGDNIGHRWIELYQIKNSLYSSFEFNQEKKMNSNSIANYLSKENKTRAVKLRGIPFNSNEDEIMEFFKVFNIKRSDVIIERDNGKMTGNALVFLQSRAEALKARETLHMRYMGKRYIEVQLCEDIMNF